MDTKPDSKFKLAYRELQKEFTQLKEHWLPAVWAHAQSIKGEITDAKDQIKHFLGVK